MRPDRGQIKVHLPSRMRRTHSVVPRTPDCARGTLAQAGASGVVLNVSHDAQGRTRYLSHEMMRLLCDLDSGFLSYTTEQKVVLSCTESTCIHRRQCYSCPRKFQSRSCDDTTVDTDPKNQVLFRWIWLRTSRTKTRTINVSHAFGMILSVVPHLTGAVVIGAARRTDL